MRESREPVLVVEGRLDERLVEQAFEAAAEGSRSERIRNGLESAIEVAEMDLDKAREALWTLRRDHATLERVEACLGGSSERATLALGAAIQLADAELASSDPDLRSRLPELLRWLQDEW